MYNREKVEDMQKYNGTYAEGDSSGKTDTENLLERFLRSSEHMANGETGQKAKKTYSESLKFLNNYHMVPNSGGGKNDCLIISFLMGVSPTYRKLAYDIKYTVASTFRREYLPKAINTNKGLLRKNDTEIGKIIERLQGTAFLLDTDMGILSRLYNINILSLETYKTEGARKEGPNAKIVGTNDKKVGSFDGEGIIIINRSNGHYETVAKSIPAVQYVFSAAELNAFYHGIMDKNPYKIPDVPPALRAAANGSARKVPGAVTAGLQILKGLAEASVRGGGRRTKRRKSNGRKTKRKTRR